MPKAIFHMHWRRIAPWLLFGAWLTVSSAYLWALEIEAVRAGVLCGADSSKSGSKGPQWIQDLLR